MTSRSLRTNDSQIFMIINASYTYDYCSYFNKREKRQYKNFRHVHRSYFKERALHICTSHDIIIIVQ